MNTKMFSVRLDNKLQEAVCIMAAQAGKTKSDIIRELVAKAIQNNQPQGKQPVQNGN